MKQPVLVGLSILFLVVLSFLLGCNEDEPKKVDPCAEKNAVTAEFKIEELYRNLEEDYAYYETDTISKGIAKFTALEADAEYFWEIGSGVYTTQEVVLDFPESTLGQTIPIKLTVTKEPDTVCFPDDPGLQVLTKNMVVSDICSAPYNGHFIGERSDDPGVAYTILIDLRKEMDTDLDCNEIYLENFDGKGCSYIWDGPGYIAFEKMFLSESGIVCDLFKFLVEVNENDSIHFNAVSVVNSESYYWSFKGKRVN